MFDCGLFADGVKSNSYKTSSVLARPTLDAVKSSTSENPQPHQNTHRDCESKKVQISQMKARGMLERNDEQSWMVSQNHATPRLLISEDSVESQL